MNRRNFLRLGALFVPAAVIEPRRVYSFIWARPEWYVWDPVPDARFRDDNLDAHAYALRAAAGEGDFLFDSNGDLQFVSVNIGELIAKSIRKTIDEAYRQRLLSLERIMIKGTVSI